MIFCEDILSTGVLRRNSSTNFITVEAMNADPNDSRSVTVRMFDWSSGSPVLLPMVDPTTQTIPPNILFFNSLCNFIYTGISYSNIATHPIRQAYAIPLTPILGANK